MALIRSAEFQKMHPAFVKNMQLSLHFFRRHFFSSTCPVPRLPAAERLQNSSDIRPHKAPENIFQSILIPIDSQVGESVLDYLIDVKCIAAGINDVAGGVGAQINQIPAQEEFCLPEGLPNKIADLTIYSF